MNQKNEDGTKHQYFLKQMIYILANQIVSILL